MRHDKTLVAGPGVPLRPGTGSHWLTLTPAPHLTHLDGAGAGPGHAALTADVSPACQQSLLFKIESPFLHLVTSKPLFKERVYYDLSFLKLSGFFKSLGVSRKDMTMFLSNL